MSPVSPLRLLILSVIPANVLFLFSVFLKCIYSHFELNGVARKAAKEKKKILVVGAQLSASSQSIRI